MTTIVKGKAQKTPPPKKKFLVRRDRLKDASVLGLLAILVAGLITTTAFGEEIVNQFTTELLYSEDAESALSTLPRYEGDYAYKVVYQEHVTEYYEGYYWGIEGYFAILVAYTGTEQNVTVPSTIGGYPVKVLDGTFAGNDTVKSVTIPEGVVYGSGVRDSSVETIYLPSTWCPSNTYNFYDKYEFYQVASITVAEANPYYCSIDGNLYSKDKTELICYAGGSSATEFTIPEFTSEINSSAFSGTIYLQTLNMSNAINEVKSFYLGDSIRTLNLGNNINGVEEWNYSNNLETINVSAENPYYASESGVLYNKDKSILVIYPNYRIGETFIAPPSVRGVEEYAFYKPQYLSELVFPSRIEFLSEKAFPSDNTSIEIIVFRNGIFKSELPTPSAFDSCIFVGDNSVRDALGEWRLEYYLNPDLSLTVLDIHDQYFTGKPITGATEYWGTFSYPGLHGSLKEGRDYRVIHENNIYPGEAKVTIIGIGEFWGSASDTFYIEGGSNFEHWSGWIQDSNGWWYHLSNGTYPKNQWYKIGQSWYFFDSSGYMHTGWLMKDGSWYYLKTDGSMATGWTDIKNSWYYMDGAGIMQTGWQQIGGKWYYLGTNGVMTTGWQKVGGVWYYLNDSGVMQTGWQQIDESWYYFNGSGAMQTGWLQTGSKWYFLKSSGVMATGWVSVGGTWYYMNASGIMQTGWQQIGDSWYYLKSSGTMATGWYQAGSKWYYFNSSGVMQTNRWIGNYWVGESGAMATNTTVDGGRYRVGADGLWVKTA